MTPSEANAVADEVQLLDVREPPEWDAGHIEGAVHVPMGELSSRQGELAQDRTIVAVCRSGNRSGQVSNALRRAGYEVENLEGGMQAWQRDGLPFVAEDGQDPRVI
ncbi:MAG: rhodanese-like domain-containing protein [Nitriliruptor sp.]|uniref:rhodanese-like domain-containing protein n=1 Tax=Nitriliruptor sp. TaxID=2448056 RepID=UPI0034A08AA6